MDFKTPKQAEIYSTLVSVFGAAIGAWLSRIVVTMAASDQQKTFNWLIAIGSTGLLAFVSGKDWMANLTKSALLGMVADRTVTGAQAKMQGTMVTAKAPADGQTLTITSKIMNAAAGFNSGKLGNPNQQPVQTYDASLWAGYKDVAEREDNYQHVPGVTVSKKLPAGI